MIQIVEQFEALGSTIGLRYSVLYFIYVIDATWATRRTLGRSEERLGLRMGTQGKRGSGAVLSLAVMAGSPVTNV